MKNCIIGIVARHFSSDGNPARPNVYIRDENKDAIYSNGAIPIAILSPTLGKNVITSKEENLDFDAMVNNLAPADKNRLIATIKMCDGILLQGGAVADDFEVFVAKYCHTHNIPVLGICEGQSNLLRAVGGSVKLVDNPNKHNNGKAKYVHPIEIDKNSLLYKIVKSTNILVNSRHNYTPDKLGCMRAVAWDDDGNVEVVLDPKKTFYLGVRFHPESLCKDDIFCGRIFKFFISTCKKAKQKT